jgi:hypothetical protein
MGALLKPNLTLSKQDPQEWGFFNAQPLFQRKVGAIKQVRFIKGS